MKQRRLHLSMFCVVAVFFALFELAGAADNPIIGVLDKDTPYAMVSPDLFGKLGEDLKLPDGGKHIKELTDKNTGRLSC